MASYYTEMVKRRKKRAADLKKKLGHPYSKSNALMLPGQKEAKRKKNRLIKTLFSLLLLLMTYFLYQTNHPYAKIAQQFINESLTREYNFNGVYQWYQTKFEGFPGILPTFKIQEKEERDMFISPVSPTPENIRRANVGIYLQTKENTTIHAIRPGLVMKIEESGNLGQTVTIRHQNGLESIYAMLETLYVEKNNWVEEGTVIGRVNNRFYFALRDQEHYINPMEVISFD